MFRDKKITIAIIVVLIISVIGLGIAFAAFSQTLTINGTGTVESSSWSVVFEGADGSNTLGAPTLTGTATEVTHPTIKNNQTEISTYEVLLKTPGDSVTYNFKIHNKGDYAANLTSLTVAGVNRPFEYVNGEALVTDSAVYSANVVPLSFTHYSFYYTSDNVSVGRYAARDCLEPGETVNVSLSIQFASTREGTYVLPSEDIVLDNLGISATYTQSNNGSCPLDPGTSVVDSPFENIEYSYYTYEGKSFIGTGVNNVILSESLIGRTNYASAKATECSDGSAPTSTGSGVYKKTCPEGTTPVFVDHPALDMASAYCTGCRLMTREEATLWGCASGYGTYTTKCTGYYNGQKKDWWLADTNLSEAGYVIYQNYGSIDTTVVTDIYEYVRPAVSIPAGATMTGSGTQLDPYVITVN